MNRKTYRLVYSRMRGMLVAVDETATASGRQAGETAACGRKSRGVIFSLRRIAFAAFALPGALPSMSAAQIVPGGAHAPSVVQTQNGLDQVNINRPSSAGVSMNTYGRFDVPSKGAILNNAPLIVQTQQAGMINGNPNFGPGQSARVIVNQVNSSVASQINGHVEVAGRRAEVVIANGSGISVNGGGFINTSRAILTTGTPNFAPDGSLSGFNVTGGTITVQGAGLNAGDTEQVDLLSRAVQANAAIYAKNLNVVTGTNSIRHDTLNATPIAGDGPALGVSIDVSQLGGMYANRIALVGTANGVGVSNRGVLAAQAGDLVLSTGGLLTLAGQTSASGNMALSAAGGIVNSGTTYAQQNVTANTSGALTNSGVLAAQQNMTVDAGSVASTGTLGAGVNGDGSLAQSGDLSVTAAGMLAATGRNAAGGNAALNGAAVSLAGSSTSANGSLQLAASGGDLNLSGATTTAGGALDTRASGTLTNDGGVLSSGGPQTVSAGALSNRNGQIVSGTTLNVVVTSDLQNQGGTLQAAGALSVNADSLSNVGGQIITAGQLAAQAGSLNNANGVLAAQQNIAANIAGDVNNTQGAIRTLSSLSLASGGALTNTGGQIGATRNLSVDAVALTGGGAYSAAHDVAVSIRGDFAPTPDLEFAAGHDLSFTLPGRFDNSATLQAVNNLGINAGDIANGGVLMAGSTLTTHSNTLENTGVMVGGSVSLNATQSIQNVGPTALIGATDSNGTLELLAPDIENRDDTTRTDTQATTAIYGLGKVVLAGGKNADGSYTHANLIRNQSGLIESAADMELHAAQVTNTRTTMTTTGLNQPVDPALLDQRGVSMSGCTAVNMAACAGQDVGWSSATPSMIGGVNIEPPHGGQWNSGYQYTTYTGVALANLIASISPQAQIIAGGNLDASSVDLFQNYWSQVAAVGNIALPTTLDQDSWRGQTAPNVEVTYSGYYHYNNYDNAEHNWTLPFGDAPFVGTNPGGYQAAPAYIRKYGLPDYESGFVAGSTLAGTGVNIDNTAGNAGIPSLGLAAGQSVTGVNAGAVIARATAVDVLSNLTVPQGGLFKPATSPGAGYLIETNPAFTNQKTFISSDYYLQQLGLNPQTTEKRLGDGFYEQQLVRNQVTSLTGKAVMGPYTDLQSMYQVLLAAGASLSQSLNLPLGMSLSPGQVAALTGNVIIMQTEIVDGQSVLVPVVYLAKASQQNMNGPLVAATDIDIQNAQTLTSSGTVQAGNTLSIQGNQISNAFGSLQSGGLMSLTTKGNVDLTSATVNAGSLALNAGGDLLLNTAVKTVDQVSATGATRTTTTLGPIANLNVTGDALIVTGGNVEQNAGNLNVGGNLGMAVGGSYDLGSVQTGEHKIVAGANGVSNTNANQTTSSSLNVGGVSQIGVGGDLTATGANISLAGGGVLAANGNVTFQAAKATSAVDSSSSGSDSHGSYSESLQRSDDTLTATTLNAGNSLTVASGRDISVTGSAISLDKGTATLAATSSVNIGAATETHVVNSREQHKHSNVVSGKEVSSSHDSTMTLSQGGLVSADAVTIASGQDINVAGSTIVGTNDVNLAAAGNVNVTTSQDTKTASSHYLQHESGFGAGGGIGISVGSQTQTNTISTSQVTNTGSTIGSLNGNLNIVAGNDLQVTGSDLIAGKNVAGTAANVTIDSATDTYRYGETQTISKSGFTLAIKSPVIDALSITADQAHAAGHSRDDRAAALHGIAAASGAADAAGALANGAVPEVKVELSYGSSRSKNTNTEDSVARRGSNVMASGTVAFVATGNGTSGGGNVTIAGSNVNANDVILAANNQVNLVNTTDTDSTRSTNESSSASVGVSYGTQGFGVAASMSRAHGNANSDTAVQNNAHVTAASTATIISGGDTNIIGANVSGNQVNADIGGSLNIASVQDTMSSSAHQESTGGGFAISQGGGSASFSHTNANASGSYAGVNEQAGIQAGDGGFSISVRSRTDLKGAVIESDGDASKNTLSTGALTYSDIQNSSSYSAHTGGIGVGVTTGDGGANYNTSGSMAGHNAGGVAPTLSQNDSGSDSAATRSGVSAGTVSVTDAADQTSRQGTSFRAQDIASLSRDTTNTNNTVAKQPDVNNLLDRQADMMAAAGAAGEAVSRRIGDYADQKAKAAGGDGGGWQEGGVYRAEMQAAGAALVTGLAGGNAIGGAAGAGIGSIAGGNLNKLSGAIADSEPTGNASMNEALGNMVANAVATGAGAAVGGNAGAFESYNVDRFNRQLHPEEKNLAKQLADKSGGKYTEAQIEEQMRIMGVSVNGKTQSGVPDTLIGQMPTDSGATWTFAGTTDGKSILTQQTAATDPQLQAYIMGNYNTVSSGAVPSAMTYTPSPSLPTTGSSGIAMNTAGAICPKGNCGVTNGSAQMPTQQQFADAAGAASAQLGIASATAAAIASYTGDKPYISGPAATFSFATGAGSFALGGLQQALAPNVGQYFTEGTLIGLAGYYAGDRYPLIGPAVAQAGNMLPNSKTVGDFEKSINSRINSLLNR